MSMWPQTDGRRNFPESSFNQGGGFGGIRQATMRALAGGGDGPSQNPPNARRQSTTAMPQLATPRATAGATGGFSGIRQAASAPDMSAYATGKAQPIQPPAAGTQYGGSWASPARQSPVAPSQQTPSNPPAALAAAVRTQRPPSWQNSFGVADEAPPPFAAAERQRQIAEATASRLQRLTNYAPPPAYRPPATAAPPSAPQPPAPALYVARGIDDLRNMRPVDILRESYAAREYGRDRTAGQRAIEDSAMNKLTVASPHEIDEQYDKYLWNVNFYKWKRAAGHSDLDYNYESPISKQQFADLQREAVVARDRREELHRLLNAMPFEQRAAAHREYAAGLPVIS